MTNPEQVQQYFMDRVSPQQLVQDSPDLKFISEAYKAAPASDKIDKGQNPKMQSDNNSSIKLEKEGNIESLILPSGYSEGSKDKSENFLQFNSGTNKDTRVCYWKRADFSSDEEDSQRIDEVFKKVPHTLNEQETLDMMPMMMPGRPWGTGNYKDLQLSSADIDGRRVLVADFKYNTQDRQVRLIIANQNNDKHQIENIWLEGPVKDFEKNNKSVFDSFAQIKWTK